MEYIETVAKTGESEPEAPNYPALIEGWITTGIQDHVALFQRSQGELSEIARQSTIIREREVTRLRVLHELPERTPGEEAEFKTAARRNQLLVNLGILIMGKIIRLTMIRQNPDNIKHYVEEFNQDVSSQDVETWWTK